MQISLEQALFDSEMEIKAGEKEIKSLMIKKLNLEIKALKQSSHS